MKEEGGGVGVGGSEGPEEGRSRGKGKGVTQDPRAGKSRFSPLSPCPRTETSERTSTQLDRELC
jgi:hypothetical protein